MPHGEMAPSRAVSLASTPPFRVGSIDVEPSTRQVARGRERETLEPRVMQVLVSLAEAGGAVVSRDQLILRCWDGNVVGDNAIQRVISRLRELAANLGQGSFAIETITKVGYRIIAADAGPASTALEAVPWSAQPRPATAEAEHWGAFGLVTFWRRGSRLTGHSPALIQAAPKRRLRLRIAIAALLLLVAIAAGSLLLVRNRSAATEPVSLAVLPFRNLSAGDAYFAEGVAEEILTQLSRQPGLRVAGRTSSWMFGDSADPRDVGNRLDVAYLLEGSVRRAGQQVRVDVALVGTGDGMRRWSQSFEGSLDDILAIQGRIGNAVASSLQRQFVPAAAPPRQQVTRGDVYNLYLTARGLLRTREPANVETAGELLRRAVRIDPNYAPAWAMLADATAARALTFATSPATMRSLYAEATRYAERAVRLAPGLPEAHGAAALVADDVATALRELEEAVRLAPGDAELWYGLSEARAAALDFEGELEALRRVAEIDPFWVRAAQYPVAAWLLGSRGEALAFEARMIRHHPEALGRLSARTRVAGYRLDWSEAYRLSREADRLRPLQVRAREFFPEPIFLRLRLDRLDEAGALMSFPVVLDLVRGTAPPMPELLRQVGSPQAFWAGGPARRAALLRLNQQGRGADILSLYDAVYSSPEAMARSSDSIGFVASAGPVIVALRDVGRRAEADRLLALADHTLGRALAGGRVPFDTVELAARVRALQGRREESLRLLERAVAMGWQWQFVPIAPRLADDPVYRAIRGEPRLQRLDAMIQDGIARERREAAALGI